MVIELVRKDFSDEGTFGGFDFRGTYFHTGELPWRDNRSSVSCIPDGTYLCSWNYSNEFRREMYGLHAVPGRDGIRFHAANFCGDRENPKLKSELKGCIALGLSVGPLYGQKALLSSGEAVKLFEKLLGKESFTLKISKQLGQ